MAKKKEVRPKYTCRDCAHSFNYHEKDIYGNFFMCKCKFHEWSKFLNHSYCENFDKKKDGL